MRKAAQSHPLVEFCDATAEQTHFPAASVDLITSFQAFHWFNPQPTLSEFRRILIPSGRLAIIWNQRAADDKFSVDFDRLVKASIDFLQKGGKNGKSR
jgi:ubiquinone/menaquinone biosynthesis C-methylase UbiE